MQLTCKLILFYIVALTMAPGRIMLREVLSSEVPKKAAFIVNVVRLWSIPKFGRSQGVLAIHMVLQDEEVTYFILFFFIEENPFCPCHSDFHTNNFMHKFH